jgi:hypothetical protein
VNGRGVIAPAVGAGGEAARTVQPLDRFGFRWIALAAAGLGAVVSATALPDDTGWWTLPATTTRISSAVATVGALALVTWRTGGRTALSAVTAGIVLALVVEFPEPWSLAGASVAAACTFGLLGMLVTRPASGVHTIGELLVSTVVGLAGAAVLSGFVVDVRPYRERVIVMTLVLVVGLALAWRLGDGFGTLGRQGAVLTVVALLALVAAVAYAAAVRTWGSTGFLTSVTDAQNQVRHYLGAVPRLAEALIGFPALLWGVTLRRRHRRGWWLCAFGALGPAGLATGFAGPDTSTRDAFIATGDGLLIGVVLGAALIGIDRILTGAPGRRSAVPDPAVAESPDHPRLAPLL